MTETWMATFEVDIAALRALLPLVASTQTNLDVEVPAGVFVVEVIRLENGQHLVLLCTADSASAPSVLRCWTAFGSDVAECDSYRDQGFPVTEATIEVQNQSLVVYTNYYPRSGSLGMEPGRLLSIQGIGFGGSEQGAQDTPVVYRQLQSRPDLNRPGFDIVGASVNLTSRRRVKALGGQSVSISFESALFPDFSSLWPSQTSTVPQSVIYGRILSGLSKPKAPPSELVSLRKAGSIGEPNYVFEDMELFGFRIDVPQAPSGEDPLSKLIKPLNFHLTSSPDQGRGSIDFEYQAATRSIVVELLHYGKMKYRDGCAAVGADHYMSQHELLVRVLVGRVDQDSAQARDPATYVATIFVDNPVSKAVGRELQGYPKKLAHFCRRKGQDLERVDNIGKANGERVALEKICAICLATDFGQEPSKAQTLLEVAYSTSGFSDDALVSLDASSFLGAAELAGLPWRQGDFDDVAFRRAFAREVLANRFQRSRSVQVVPLDGDVRSQTWLTGTFELTNIRFQRPSGIATLTFYPDTTDQDSAWSLLSMMLNESTGTRSVSLPSGDWYRVKCNMDLTIDDGLAW